MRVLFWLWALASLCWIAAVGYDCVRTWPRLSLDLSPGDPGTQAAYDAALSWHLFGYGAIAVVPPLVILIVAQFFTHRQPD